MILSLISVGTFGSAAGYVTALQGAEVLAVPFLFENLIDHCNLLFVMAAADVGRARVLALTMALWLVTGEPQGWALIACVAVLAGGQSLFGRGMQKSLPGLARDSSTLPSANALLDTTERIARLPRSGLVGFVSVCIPLVHFVCIDVPTFLPLAFEIMAVTRFRPLELTSGTRRKRETPLSAMLRGVRVVWRLIRAPSLDRRKVEFFDFNHIGVLDAPVGFISEIGGLLPMAPCGRSSL